MKLDREMIQTRRPGKSIHPSTSWTKKSKPARASEALEKESPDRAATQRVKRPPANCRACVQNVNGIPLISTISATRTAISCSDCRFTQRPFQRRCRARRRSENAVTLIATVSADFTSKVQAEKSSGHPRRWSAQRGRKPDNARAAAKDASKLDEALAKAKTLLAFE